MNKVVKKLWIKALRSGKYRQARDTLKADYSGGSRAYCCLGVLTNLYAKEHNMCFGAVLDRTASLDSDLSRRVMNWAGLNSRNPKVGDNRLITINDGNDGCVGSIKPHNFKQIANLIQRYL